MAAPNLMADSSFESRHARAFNLVPPFRVAADANAHSGKADLQATLSHSGKRMFSHLSVWCDGTPKSPPLWRNLMIGGAMGGTPNTFFDYVRVYAIDPKASAKVVGK
jgi:hypothetical protein